MIRLRLLVALTVAAIAAYMLGVLWAHVLTTLPSVLGG